MKRTLALTMGLAAMVALIGCGKDNPTSSGSSQKPVTVAPSPTASLPVERLIGTWNAKDGRSSIAFRKDGWVDVTFLSNGSSVKVSGTYMVSGYTLTMAADAMEKGKDTSLFTTYTCAIQEEMLILTSSEGKTTAWVRMPPATVTNS